MKTTDCLAPTACREEAYLLLSRVSPSSVVIDTDLPPGTWYLVRAPHEWERAKLLQQEMLQSERLAAQVKPIGGAA